MDTDYSPWKITISHKMGRNLIFGSIIPQYMKERYLTNCLLKTTFVPLSILFTKVK